MDHSDMDYSDMDYSDVDYSDMDYSDMDYSDMDYFDMDYSLFCRALHKLADITYPKLSHNDAIKTLGNHRVFCFAKIEPLLNGYSDAFKKDCASKSPRILSMMQQSRAKKFVSTYALYFFLVFYFRLKETLFEIYNRVLYWVFMALH